MNEKLDWNNGWSRKSDDAKSSAIAPNYSRTGSYQVGDLVMQNGQLYKNTTAIAEGGERWNPAHWELTDAVSVAKESGNKDGLSTALDNNHYSVEIDGREYRCTKIGNQLWMSENLDAEVGTLGTSSETEGANEWYYNYDEAFAKSRNYGRLYTWDNLNENLAGKLTEWGIVTEDGKGWHWPSEEEYKELFKNIGAVPDSEEWPWPYQNGSYKLQAVETGLDEYAFSILMSGCYNVGSKVFYNAGKFGELMPSDGESGDYCYYIVFMHDSDLIYSEAPHPSELGNNIRLVLTLNPDGTIPDDFKKFVKIRGASAAENLVQSNTVRIPGVFGTSDAGTPISKVFEQYKTSGSLRVLMKDNSDIEVVCEANVDIIHASAGDTMMLWIDNPDVPNGKILYELDDGMTEWPEPTFIKTPYNAPEDGEVYGLKNGEWAKAGASLPKRFTGVGSFDTSSSVMRILTSGSVSFPISDSSYEGAGYISWVMQAVMAPQSLDIKTGDKFELKINHSQALGTMSNMFFALARTTAIVTTGGPTEHRYEVLTKPIAPRALTGVQNEAFSGQTASNPLIFEFKKDARFRAGDYLFLMVGKKRDDTDWSGFLMVGNQATGAWNDPIAFSLG